METKTMKLGTKDYAQVKDRILEFRKANPRGSIKTEPTIQDDGSVIFKAYILKDKAKRDSADATGHAHSSEVKGAKEKQFEKLETVAVGRALANLGYSTGGEIASSEEMELFEEDQQEKLLVEIDVASKKLEGAKTLGELRDIWANLDGKIKEQCKKLKEELKSKLEKPTKKDEGKAV